MRGFRPGSRAWDAAEQIYTKFGSKKFRHADLKQEGISIHPATLSGMRNSGIIEIPSDEPEKPPKRRYSANTAPHSPTQWRLTQDIIQKFEAQAQGVTQ